MHTSKDSMWRWIWKILQNFWRTKQDLYLTVVVKQTLRWAHWQRRKVDTWDGEVGGQQSSNHPPTSIGAGAGAGVGGEGGCGYLAWPHYLNRGVVVATREEMGMKMLPWAARWRCPPGWSRWWVGCRWRILRRRVRRSCGWWATSSCWRGGPCRGWPGPRGWRACRCCCPRRKSRRRRCSAGRSRSRRRRRRRRSTRRPPAPPLPGAPQTARRRPGPPRRRAAAGAGAADAPAPLMGWATREATSWVGSQWTTATAAAARTRSWWLLVALVRTHDSFRGPCVSAICCRFATADPAVVFELKRTCNALRCKFGQIRGSPPIQNRNRALIKLNQKKYPPKPCLLFNQLRMYAATGIYMRAAVLFNNQKKKKNSLSDQASNWTQRGCGARRNACSLSAVSADDPYTMLQWPACLLIERRRTTDAKSIYLSVCLSRWSCIKTKLPKHCQFKSQFCVLCLVFLPVSISKRPLSVTHDKFNIHTVQYRLPIQHLATTFLR